VGEHSLSVARTPLRRTTGLLTRVLALTEGLPAQVEILRELMRGGR
jgi:hypothetical protein